MARPTELDFNEKKAVQIGGNAAGGYLDQIGIFDLSRLSPEQWTAFCETMFRETCAELRRQADDEIPF